MPNELYAAIFGDTASKDTGAESFYECTVCGTTFDEWPTTCPNCGQLVVRIVAPESSSTP